MNWERAKSLIILFLIMLNAFLAFLLLAGRESYRITQQQEDNILTVLRNNKITMSAEMLTSYAPMAQIGMRRAAYPTDVLVKAFFKNSAVNISGGNGETLFQNGTASLSIQDNYITFTATDGGLTPPIADLTVKSAVADCDAFVNTMGDRFRQFIFDYASPVEGGFQLEYREKYKNRLIYSDFIVFTVTGKGIVSAEGMFDEVEGYVGNSREICSPDEALLTFMRRMKNTLGDKEIEIVYMDMVYYQPEVSAPENSELKAVPCYRIYVKDSHLPYLIDAYQNLVV